MTEQEAIEDFKRCIGCGVYEGTALIAINALEKQIPKKPILITNLMTKRKYKACPVCEIQLSPHQHFTYCDKCGQKYDWSES